ncbi:S1 family peptidase [Streptomyces gamaensis]|uniref:S1 family peptidase n=1 Tax=Streptomyces gamaensis TaxID=1763542 RepID=A0ABW0YPV9_9ACTN
MSAIRLRAAWLAGALASATAASLLTAAPANAVVGEKAKDGSYAFTAKLDIGGERGCSAALVEQQWVLAAASCFADTPGAKVAPGAPKLRTMATIGRTDLTRGDQGSVASVVELVPREDRDLVMAKLDRPITNVSPANLAFTRPLPGEDLWITGYGRTKDEWVPDRLHSAKFAVEAVKDTTVTLSGKSDGAAVCQGDTGGPAFRIVGGRYELVGVNSRSWQGGCLGVDDKEKRTGAVDARVDDVAGWIQAVYSRDVLGGTGRWKSVKHMASGNFTSGPLGSKRRSDLFVVWEDGSSSLFQGADHNDPKYPFSAEYKITDKGSFWKSAVAITGGRFTDSGTDGIVVRWDNGRMSLYNHFDENGPHNEKELFTQGGWQAARLITVGRYTDNPLRDDLLVLWDNGATSLFSDIGANGADRAKQLMGPNSGWQAATQISSGEITGKKTADLVIVWSDGDTTVFPGVDADGYHGRTRIKDPGSAWKFARVVTTGSFTAVGNGLNDILVRWEDGVLSCYPGVDANGLHGAVDLNA